MASPPPTPRSPARRTRRPSALLIVGFACAVAILVEVGAITGCFGLAGWHWGSQGPTAPDLNPYGERILAITGNTTYFGPIHGYFPSLDDTNLCGPKCPELPRQWPSDGILPDEVGVFFYYNVTNTANILVNLSQPVVSTSGPVSTLFFLETFCCYTTTDPPYVELIDSAIPASPGLEFGLEGYAYTTEPLPTVVSGGYTLYVNFTSN